MSLKFSAAFLPFGYQTQETSHQISSSPETNQVLTINSPLWRNFCKDFCSSPVKRFVAEEMSLDLYVDPLAMVDEISALGLRHVGYGVPTELFQPLVLAYVEALKCTKCWKTSFFLLLFQGICWFLRVKLMEVNINLFSRRWQVVNLFKDSHWLQGPWI